MVSWEKFRKSKSYFNNFSIVEVKYEHSPLGPMNFVSQEWIHEKGWFFAFWYKFRKAKTYLNNYWMGIVKNVRDLIHHGLLSHVYLPNDLMNWAYWVNDFCMLIVMEQFLYWLPIYSVSLTSKYWGTTAVLSPFLKNDLKIGFFVVMKKFVIDFWWNIPK